MGNMPFKKAVAYSKWVSTIANYVSASQTIPPEEWTIDKVVDSGTDSLSMVPSGLKMEPTEEQMQAIRQYLIDTKEFANSVYENVVGPMEKGTENKSSLSAILQFFKESGRFRQVPKLARPQNELPYEAALYEYLLGDKPTYEPPKAR
jgi:hypothetical protein